MQELRDAGYLPEAVRNYLALLGWGDADDETILSTDELVERFRIERVSRNPARFDEQKLRWLNGRYLRELGRDELTAPARGLHRPRGARARGGHLRGEDADAGRLLAAGRLHRRRPGRRPGGPREVARRAGPRRARRRARRAARTSTRSPSRASSTRCEAVVDARGAKPKDVFQPVRVALAGTTVSPGIFETLEVLGRDESLRRIDAALSA